MSKSKSLNYVFAYSYVLVALSAIGIYLGSIFNWIGVFIIFVIFPMVEFLFPKLKLIRTPDLNFFSDLLLFASPVALTTLVFWSGFKFLETSLISEKWGIVLSVGSITGSLGITIAHELVHRKEAWQRAPGVWNLLLVNFGHWGVEHVFGHHKTVGTQEDHASATKNQWLYSFWLADYFGGLSNSFQFERKRIQGKKFYFLRNRILNYSVISILLTFALYIVNPSLIAFWWGQSIVAILLLLSVDYIEHYGLRRTKKANGLYEPVNVQHSWDTESYITNVILFNLGLHSHHHMKARVPYQELQPQPGARTMPYGYSAMILMAFVPPLYFKKMNSII